MKEIKQQLYCVGVKHRMKRDIRAALNAYLTRSVSTGSLPVTFTREQENKFDINAIRVNFVGAVPIADIEDNHFLGYIGAESAEILAPLMDDGTLDIIDVQLVAIENALENSARGVMQVTMVKHDA